jgi:hypothetical protein
MIYKGNYSSWIQDKWINYLLNNDGSPRPKTRSENPDSEEFRIATVAGYDLNNIYWYHYTSSNKTFPISLEIPFENERSNIWWFIKMNPGMFMPMHRDPHTEEEINCRRYWMALQDYEPGHIFIYNKELIVDYKKGDIYMYDDSRELHGACNIGYTPRLVFNFSTYDV